MTQSTSSTLFKFISSALGAIVVAALTGLWAYAAAIATESNINGKCVATNTEAIERIDDRHRDDMGLLRDELKQMREELVRIREEQTKANLTMAGVLAELKARSR